MYPMFTAICEHRAVHVRLLLRSAIITAATDRPMKLPELFKKLPFIDLIELLAPFLLGYESLLCKAFTHEKENEHV